MQQHVSASEIPLWMAERVARVSHARSCGPLADRTRAVNGNIRTLTQERHHAGDVLTARVALADMCTALTVKPEELGRLWRYHNPGVQP